MPFQRDERYAAEIGNRFGEYLTTYVSQPAGQVRAYIFQNRGQVIAHVSFPKGVPATDVTEPFMNQLWNYARENKIEDKFHLVMS